MYGTLTIRLRICNHISRHTCPAIYRTHRHLSADEYQVCCSPHKCSLSLIYSKRHSSPLLLLRVFLKPQSIMLLMALAWQVVLAFDALLENSQGNLISVISVIALMSGWLVWRLWRFIIFPQIYPDDPQELPYCIPGKSIKHQLPLFLSSCSFCL